MLVSPSLGGAPAPELFPRAGCVSLAAPRCCLSLLQPWHGPSLPSSASFRRHEPPQPMFGNFLSCSGPPGTQQGAPTASGGEGGEWEGSHCSPSSQRSLASAALALQRPPRSSSSGICLKSWVQNEEVGMGQKGWERSDWHPRLASSEELGPRGAGTQSSPEHSAVSHGSALGQVAPRHRHQTFPARLFLLPQDFC